MGVFPNPFPPSNHVHLQVVSEDDGIEMEDQAETSTNNATDPASKDRKVMTVDQLNSDMEQMIDEVARILLISKGMCRILLNKFNWNKESLLERYYENPDTEAFLKQCQVIPENIAPLPKDTTGECPVCCNIVPLDGLPCHHWVCTRCWESYLKTKVGAFSLSSTAEKT